MDMEIEHVAKQLRAMGVSEELIPEMLSQVRYHLTEHGSAQIFSMADGSLRVGSAHAPPYGQPAINAAVLPDEGVESESEEMSRDLGLYVDVVSGIEYARSDSLKDKLERMARVLETKLEEDVEDYISATQMETHRVSNEKLVKRLATWKDAVSKGQTQKSFKEWDDSLPPV